MYASKWSMLYLSCTYVLHNITNIWFVEVSKYFKFSFIEFRLCCYLVTPLLCSPSRRHFSKENSGTPAWSWSSLNQNKLPLQYSTAFITTFIIKLSTNMSALILFNFNGECVLFQEKHKKPCKIQWHNIFVFRGEKKFKTLPMLKVIPQMVTKLENNCFASQQLNFNQSEWRHLVLQ